MTLYMPPSGFCGAAVAVMLLLSTSAFAAAPHTGPCPQTSDAAFKWIEGLKILNSTIKPGAIAAQPEIVAKFDPGIVSRLGQRAVAIEATIYTGPQLQPAGVKKIQVYLPGNVGDYHARFRQEQAPQKTICVDNGTGPCWSPGGGHTPELPQGSLNRVELQMALIFGRAGEVVLTCNYVTSK